MSCTKIWRTNLECKRRKILLVEIKIMILKSNTESVNSTNQEFVSPNLYLYCEQEQFKFWPKFTQKLF